MKELKVEVPQGYEIDEDNSTFACIKFNKASNMVKSWRELDCISGWYIDNDSDIEYIEDTKTFPGDINVWATKEQADACLALSQLSQLMERYKFDTYSKKSHSSHVYCIRNNACGVDIKYSILLPSENRPMLTFYNIADRQEFIENHIDLIKTALPLL